MSILCSIWRPAHTFLCRMYLTFWPKIKQLPGLDHVCVKFGYPSCISFLRYCVYKQTDKQNNKHINTTKHPTHVTAVDAGNERKQVQRESCSLCGVMDTISGIPVSTVKQLAVHWDLWWDMHWQTWQTPHCDLRESSVMESHSEQCDTVHSSHSCWTMAASVPLQPAII